MPPGPRTAFFFENPLEFPPGADLSNSGKEKTRPFPKNKTSYSLLGPVPPGPFCCAKGGTHRG